MLTEPLFLEPVYQERIWGGNKLRTLFEYDIPNEKTGEAWVISAHQHGSSRVLNGRLKGKTLKEVWDNHGELFGESTEKREFPLLVKILDANDNLSVQVHPDDKYAMEHEGEAYGKTECWYVLEAEPNAEIIFGHHAQSREEFQDMVEKNEWKNLLRYEKVKKGDFIYVPSGTIHALGEGLVILEIQQSSDVTYRVYDYERQDADGELRDLHIDSSIDVTHYPHVNQQQKKLIKKRENFISTRLLKGDYFTVYHWQVEGEVNLVQENNFTLVNIIDGSGKISIGEQSYLIKKGQHFIMPKNMTHYSLSGHLELIISYE